MSISVVITTKNEAENITDCLEAIKRQTYPREKIEIIVVDNNSRDRTKEIAARHTDKIYNFGPERSAQRNFGVRQAQGVYILYLDADMAISEKVLEECVSKSEREDLVALYIPEQIRGLGFWTRVRDFERSFYHTTCIDAVRFVRRDKFLEIGGFDENLTGPEDWDFDRRIRGVGGVGTIDAALYHNEGKLLLKKYINKKAYYAQTFDAYVMKWGKNDAIIKKQLGWYYRLIGVFTENKKWKRLLRHPALAAGMYSLRLMIAGNVLLKGKLIFK